VDRLLKSVTHGQCDAIPTVTFPVAGHRCPATGNKLEMWANAQRDGRPAEHRCTGVGTGPTDPAAAGPII